MSANTSGSIDHLSYMGSGIRRLEVLIDDYIDEVNESAVDGRLRDESQLVLQIQKAEANVHSEWEKYRSLPNVPVETDLWPSVESELDRLEAVIHHVLQTPDTPPRPLRADEPKALIDRIDALVISLRETNRAQGVELAEKVTSLSRSSIVSAVLLDTMSLVLTLVAAMLLRKTIVHAERLQEERALELEAFSGRVAHDILSPLTTVGLSLDMLRKLSKSEALHPHIERGARGLERVQGIVDSLLRFARAGARPEEGVNADVDTAVLSAIEEFKHSAEEKGITLDAESLTGYEVACSPGVLICVIENLVRNAIKYIGDAPVKAIHIRASSSSDRVRIEIEDTGPGLPVELGDSAFAPYVRGKSHKAESGIGLGLATVKRLVEAHHGMVGVRSVQGHGCTFWMELPKART